MGWVMLTFFYWTSTTLLSGSFRPDDQVCVLRSYLRQRETLLEKLGLT